MNLDELSRQTEYEHRTPVMDFNTYSAFCNQYNTGARKNGILSDEIYEKVTLDSSTVYAEINGMRIPILINVRHGLGLGYDVERSTEYAAELADQVSVLTVPIGELDKDSYALVGDAILESGPRAIYFADHDGTDSKALYSILDTFNVSYAEKPLIDERCDEDNRQASLSLYVCDALQRDPEVQKKVSLHDVQDYFNAMILPRIADRNNATLLEQGSRLTDVQRDNMWQLYLDRFQFLGENHPISMEDSKEDFLELLTSDHTMISTRYVEGYPVCFTYFTDDFKDLYWLNTPYLKKVEEDARPFETPLFFPGIVAAGSGGGHAAEVIKVFTQHSARCGLSGRVVFENTNLSEMYIPKIVHDVLKAEPVYDVNKAERLDATTYRLVRIA